MALSERDGEPERPGGVGDDELAPAERADRIRLALPENGGALLGPDSGRKGEEEGEGRRQDGGPAVSEPRWARLRIRERG